MKNALYGVYEHGYGESWENVLVYGREGYTTSVADYHSHGFYEVNIILSGNVRILLSDQSVETNASHLVLTGPGVPHFISCNPDTLYRRLYLCFSEEFMEDCGPQWERFRRMFEGGVIAVTPEQCALSRQVVEGISRESEPYRQRLLILYLLSHIFGLQKDHAVEANPAPPCVLGALSLIRENYASRLVAEEMANKLHVGRTTLMTTFKKYTGSTINGYIEGVRFKQAKRALEQGKTVREAAESCGFSDTGALIRTFQRQLGITPGQYRRRIATGDL